MVADQEVIAALGHKRRCLDQVTELAVGQPQPWSLQAITDLGQQVRHQLGVIGLAVRIGSQGQGQTAPQRQCHQSLTTQEPALALPRRPQATGHPFDDLAVHHENLEIVQGGGDGGVQLRHLGVGEDLPKAIGSLGQEGFTDRWGQVASLS